MPKKSPEIISLDLIRALPDGRMTLDGHPVRLITYQYETTPGAAPTPLLLHDIAGNPDDPTLRAYPLRDAALHLIDPMPTLGVLSPLPLPDVLTDLAPSNLALILRAARGVPHSELFRLAGSRDLFLRMLHVLRDAGLVIYPAHDALRTYLTTLHADVARAAHQHLLAAEVATESIRVLEAEGVPNAAARVNALNPTLTSGTHALALASGEATPLPPPPTDLLTGPNSRPDASPTDIHLNPYFGKTRAELYALAASFCAAPAPGAMTPTTALPPPLVAALARLRTGKAPAGTTRAARPRMRWPWKTMKPGDAVVFDAALADRAITSAHVYGSRTGQRFRTQRNSINGTVLVMLLGAAPPRGTHAQGELELSDSED